jgi:pyruvate ferredoxin oxidoreductase delta subunit
MSSSAQPRCWQDVPPATVAFGGSARSVETGLWRSMRPELDMTKCVSCLRCWVQCPDASILTDADARVVGVDLFFCKGCGVCEAVCPTRAISMRPESEFSNDFGGVGRGSDPGKVGEFVGP